MEKSSIGWLPIVRGMCAFIKYVYVYVTNAYYGVLRFGDVYKRPKKHTFCGTIFLSTKTKNKIECPRAVIGGLYCATIPIQARFYT